MTRSLKRDRLPYRWLLSVAPLHALKVVQYEMGMTRLRATQRRAGQRFAGASGLLVNVGCGSLGKPGWVNVDSAAAPGVTCVFDCRKRLPLPTGSSKAVFTEHLLEHLDYEEEAPAFLAECHRILEPGGVVRIIVPDGEKYLRAYVDGGWEAMRSFSPLAAKQASDHTTLMELVNQHFRQAGQHRFSYDYQTLAQLLRRSGFEAIAKSSYGVSRLDGIAIDSNERATESLYVEAQRA